MAFNLDGPPVSFICIVRSGTSFRLVASVVELDFVCSSRGALSDDFAVVLFTDVAAGFFRVFAEFRRFLIKIKTMIPIAIASRRATTPAIIPMRISFRNLVFFLLLFH